MNPRSALFAALVLSTGAAYPQVVTRAVALDSNGNEYSIGFGFTPTPGAAQTQAGGGLCQRLESGPSGVVGSHPILLPCFDAEIAKRDSSGNVIFSTLLGGSTDDTANAIAIDSAGFTYIAGGTGGSFPVTANAALATPASGNFAAKLSPDGSKFIYATYLPATVQTVAAIAADANGNAYLTGKTRSGHAFVIRISADGSSFVYNQVIAISQIENGTAIAVDANGNVAVAGWTQGSSSSPQNVFVTKLDASGAVIATKVLPGSGVDTTNAIQLDAAGNVYLAGATTSTDFPATPGTFEPTAIVPLWSSVPGGFATKLAPDLSIAYSTYVPASYGEKSIGVTQLALGPAGDVYLSGATGAGLAVTNTAMQPCFAPPFDPGPDPPPGPKSFVVHLDAAGALQDATYANGIQVFGLGLSGGFLLIETQSEINQPVFSISRLAFRDPPSGCLSPQVLNSATFLGTEISAGEFVTLTGMRIGPDAGVGFTPDAQGRPPLTLGGVQVLFDGQPAPLVYVQSRQINVLAPFELTGKTSTNVTVKFNNSTFGPITVPVGIRDGGIFRRQAGSADAIATNEDGSTNGPSNPAPRGSIISLWGTGFGQTAGCMTGELNISAAVSVTKPLPGFPGPFPSQSPSITYMGGAPTFLCGIEQINVLIPLDASPGPYPIHASLVDSVIYVK